MDHPQQRHRDPLIAALALAVLAAACVTPRDRPLVAVSDGGEVPAPAEDATARPAADGAALAADAPALSQPDAPTPAPADAGGGAAPVDSGCPTGQHRCPAGCVRDNETATCGQSCTPCPTIPNGGAVCDGKTCGLFCQPGYHLCDGKVCRLNNDVASCGTRCEPCPGDPNGDPSCDRNDRCALTCRNGTLNCVTRCLRPGWGFETGTDGVELYLGVENADPPRASTARAHTGRGSLAQPIRTGTRLEAHLPVCGGDRMYAPGVDLSFKTVSFWYYFDGPDPPPGTSIGLSLYGGFGALPESSFVARQWTKVSRLLDGKQFAGISLVGYSFSGSQFQGTATLYIDDLAIE
jgi:hypothetical protein